MKKKLLTAVAALLILWMAAFTADYLLVSHFREPIFVLRSATADDGGSYVCRGLGYTVTVRKYFSADSPLTLESVTMTVFGRVVAATIT